MDFYGTRRGPAILHSVLATEMAEQDVKQWLQSWFTRMFNETSPNELALEEVEVDSRVA